MKDKDLINEELEKWFDETIEKLQIKSHKTYNANGTVNFHTADGKMIITAGSGFEKMYNDFLMKEAYLSLFNYCKEEYKTQFMGLLEAKQYELLDSLRSEWEETDEIKIKVNISTSKSMFDDYNPIIIRNNK